MYRAPERSMLVAWLDGFMESAWDSPVRPNKQVSGRDWEKAARPSLSKKIWIDKTLNENSATDSKF
jgi:hypothetical protein